MFKRNKITVNASLAMLSFFGWIVVVIYNSDFCTRSTIVNNLKHNKVQWIIFIVIEKCFIGRFYCAHMILFVDEKEINPTYILYS